jgi:ornithine decarboxylase
MLHRYVPTNIFSKRFLPPNVSSQLIATAQKIDTELNYSTEGFSVLAVNLNKVQEQINTWNKYMSPIVPHYAIKAFPDEEICKLFDNFDCASQGELKQISSLGKKSENILFANTAKRPSDIKYAMNIGVNTYTADGYPECEKILGINKDANIILRLTASDEGATNVRFSGKYGINDFTDGCHIIDQLMKNKGTLKGFSFHTGSGQTDDFAFAKALSLVDKYLEYVRTKYPTQYKKVNIIDIGGGYTSGSNLELIRKSIDQYIQKYANFRWLAEPGRFMCSDVATLFVPIISQKKRNDGKFHVLANSVYHNFSCLMYDGIKPIEKENNWFLQESNQKPEYVNDKDEFEDGIIVGDTCDGIDIIYKGKTPKKLNIGSVLIFDNFGAYSQSSASPFNGLPLAYKYYLK